MAPTTKSLVASTISRVAQGNLATCRIRAVAVVAVVDVDVVAAATAPSTDNLANHN